MNRLLVVVPYSLLALVIFRASCPAAIMPYDPNTMSYPVSVEQAMESVRTWAGDPGLQLELNGISFLWTYSSCPPWYKFSAENPSQRYHVDCVTGEVTRWIDCDAAVARQQRDMHCEDPKLPSAELNLAVLQYLQAKYPGFRDKTMQAYPATGKAVMYYEVLPGDVMNLGNRAHCNIDDWTGQIYGYWARHSAPPSISIIPLIDAVQAEQIALDYVGTLEIQDCYEDGTGYITKPESAFVLENEGLVVRTDYVAERLSWDFIVHVHAMDFYTPAHFQYEVQYEHGFSSGEIYDVYVDAHTGEVFSCKPRGCACHTPTELNKPELAYVKARKPNPSALKSQPPFERGELYLNDLQWSDLMYPPLAVGNVGYLYAKYLPILYGGTITWNSGVVDLRVAGRKVILRPRAGVMEVDGKEIRLANPPMVIAGRAYVPYEAVERICGAKASWDAKEKRLSIVSGDIPLKPHFRRPEKM